MTEVCNCGGGHHTRLRPILCSFGVPPAHVYKGGRKRRPALDGARQAYGVLLRLPSPSRIPFPIWSRREGKRGRGRRKGGLRPHPLSNSVWAGGRRMPPLGPSPLSPLKPNKAHYFSQ